MVAHLFMNSSAAQDLDRTIMPRMDPSPLSKAASKASGNTVASRFIGRPRPKSDSLADKSSTRLPPHQTHSQPLGILPPSFMTGRLMFEDGSVNNDNRDDNDGCDDCGCRDGLDDAEEYDNDDMISVTSTQTSASDATVTIANISNRGRRSVSVDFDVSMSTLKGPSTPTSAVTSVSKSVSFSTVSVRTHEVVHGEHLKPEYPVVLGRGVVGDDSTYASIEHYELRCRKQATEQRRSQKMSPASVEERRQRLLAVGYSDLELFLLEGRRQELRKKQGAVQEVTWPGVSPTIPQDAEVPILVSSATFASQEKEKRRSVRAFFRPLRKMLQ